MSLMTWKKLKFVNALLREKRSVERWLKKTNCLKKEKTRARKRKQRELFEMFRRIK